MTIPVSCQHSELTRAGVTIPVSCQHPNLTRADVTIPIAFLTNFTRG
jgi:hypothetical protein